LLVRRILALALVCVLLPAAAAEARTLKKGSRGSDVRLAQRALTKLGFRTTADGVFGAKTARAVRRYERSEDLKIDGRVSSPQLRGMLKRARIKRSAKSGSGGSETNTTRAIVADGQTFPIDGTWKWGTSGNHFGERGGRHQGEDLFADCGTPLVAAEAGKVVFVGNQSAAGNYLVVRSAKSGEDHVYMHLRSAPDPAKGDTVAAGERIGAVGDTGNANGCHLHFEIWTAPGWYEGGDPRDPRPDLQAWAGTSTGS
jgi:murein DD-endopeptidase MepM/ murein hydrolase activator NlpD